MCRDHINIQADESLNTHCKTLAAFVEDGMEVDLIPLPTIYSADFQKIVDFFIARRDYCALLDAAEQGNVSIDKQKQTMDWGVNYFVNCTAGTVIDILTAANYLNSEVLIDATATNIAHRLRGKSRNEMRDILSIENDFTPEEEARIIEETVWAHD